MNIGQAAKRSGLSTKQIRDYEKSGLLPPISRSESGYRNYTEDTVNRLIFIKNARSVNFPLTTIAQLLQLNDNPQRTSAEVKAVTQQHIQILNEQISNLTQMLNLLESWNSTCQGDGTPDCPILQGLESH